MSKSKFILAFGLFLLSGAASAQYFPSHFFSGEEASPAAIEARYDSHTHAACGGGAAASGLGATSGPTLIGGGTVWRYIADYVCLPGGGIITTINWDQSVSYCPGGEAAPCAATCDGSVTGEAIVRFQATGSESDPICSDSSACQYVPTSQTDLGGGQWAVEYTGTANSCGGETPTPVTAGDQAEQCISVMGNTWCTEPDLADQNCGELNDKYICLDSVPPGNCTFYGNGDMACAATAPSPPAPDDGVTAGVPATPDSTLGSNGTTINLYSNSTVNNSQGNPAGTNQPGADPGDTEINVEIDFTDIVEPEPDPSTYDDAIVAISDATGIELDGVSSELSDPNDFGVTTSLGNTVNAAFGISTSCSDIAFSSFGYPVTIECADAQIIRDVVGWVLRVLFLIAIFNLVTRRPE